LSAFVTWIETYASIVGFFVQMVFYVVVAVSAAWAAVTFARYVKFMTSAEPEVVAPEKSVEKFVD
jgi:hypothetical protein